MYDPVLVAKVTALYNDGLTQDEVAREAGVTQKVVWNLMRRHGVKARTAAKREQRGADNHSWKGDDAGYAAMHLRVQELRGKPSRCAMCDTVEARRFEWANLTGDFSNPYDYVRLCTSCHHRLDGTVRNARKGGA